MTESRGQITENITYEESERRLIFIGSIFAIFCLMVSTVFLIWIIMIYGRFITPRLISTQSKILIPIGLPSPYVLMVADTGDILEFSYHQKKFNLDGLPNLKMLPHKPYRNIYAVERQGAIYFLSTDNKQNVIKYDLISNRHKTIPKSKFPIDGHTDIKCSQNLCPEMRTHGVQIMDHYWIILGENKDGLLSKTSLWSMKKEVWIEGPNFKDSGVPIYFDTEDGYRGNEVCLVGVGNEEAYILIDHRLVLGYNFHKMQWKNGILPQLKYGVDYTWTIHQHSCVFYQNKNYDRYLSLDL